MTIAARYIATMRHRDIDDAEEHDSAIVSAALQDRHAAVDGRDYGPLSGRGRRALDKARADFDHFEADEAPAIPADTVTLVLADYGRNTVAAVVARSIRRAA